MGGSISFPASEKFFLNYIIDAYLLNNNKFLLNWVIFFCFIDLFDDKGIQEVL